LRERVRPPSREKINVGPNDGGLLGVDGLGDIRAFEAMLRMWEKGGRAVPESFERAAQPEDHQAQG
jgi:hypothetical protein